MSNIFMNNIWNERGGGGCLGDGFYHKKPERERESEREKEGLAGGGGGGGVNFSLMRQTCLIPWNLNT